MIEKEKPVGRRGVNQAMTHLYEDADFLAWLAAR
jgi:hypothetical protein